jgi:transposase
MELYIGVDFHPYQQTICWCDSGTGELRTREIMHKNREELVQFYRQMPPSIIGIEATSPAGWFEDLLFENKHRLWIGDPAKISKRNESRHRSDKRDAEHIYNLLWEGRFPAIWRRTPENVAILDLIGLRSALVKERTQNYNRLQAIARDIGLPKGSMETKYYKQLLRDAKLSDSKEMRRDILFETVDHLSERILRIEEHLETEAKKDKRVELLKSQPGVGTLTALCLLHTIGDFGRFTKPKQVPAFVGLVPTNESSGMQIKLGSISRVGSPLMRFMLGQAANTAVRRDERFKAFYKRLCKRKHKAVAKTAAARKLLVKLTIMLRDNITAEEFDLRGRAVGMPGRKEA